MFKRLHRSQNKSPSSAEHTLEHQNYSLVVKQNSRTSTDGCLEPVTRPDRRTDIINIERNLLHTSSNETMNPLAVTYQNQSPTSVQVLDPFGQFFSHVESRLLRYPHDPGRLAGKPEHGRPKSISLPQSECERVWRQYFTLRTTPIPDRIKHSLTLHSFNNWLYSDAQLLSYLKFMFLDLDLPQSCNIPVEVLETWLLAVYRRYNDVPFHNFKHVFTVTQMMYSLIKQADLMSYFSALDLFLLLFCALSHDLDHPGFTNSYQINNGSWLALRYNDRSPLENHHCAVAFDLISDPITNIACGLTGSDLAWFRKAAIRCILATDMTTHGSCVCQFREILPTLVNQKVNDTTLPTSVGLSQGIHRGTSDDHLRSLFASEPETKLCVMVMLLKVCDISNEVRPAAVADPWLDCLLDEFFYQAEIERRAGLPVAPHMDPKLVTRSNSQVGFIKGVVLPLFEDVEKVFPQLRHLVVTTQERLAYYTLLGKQHEDSDNEATNMPGIPCIYVATPLSVTRESVTHAVQPTPVRVRLSMRGSVVSSSCTHGDWFVCVHGVTKLVIGGVVASDDRQGGMKGNMLRVSVEKREYGRFNVKTRTQIIKAFWCGEDWRTMAITNGIMCSSAYKCIHVDYVQYEPLQHKGHRMRILNEIEIYQLMEWISADPTVTLDFLRL